MSQGSSRPFRTPGIHIASPAQLEQYVQSDNAKGAREPLNEDGIAFLAQMAGKVALATLAEDFPHVVNKLSSYRYDPSQMLHAIDGVLIEDRPERHGFPFLALTELGRLRERYSFFP